MEPAISDPDAKAAYGYRFGDFRLYPAQRRLLRGGEDVDPGDMLFNFMAFMISNAGRTIPYKEIMAGAWSRGYVGDSNMLAYGMRFRQWFGPESMKTVHSVGHHCTLIVEPIAEPPPPVRASVKPARPARPSKTLPDRSDDPVGREDELAQLAADLEQRRLITIVGPGGIGKTWLAVELGWRLAESFPGGVHFIDVAHVGDAEVIASSTAAALGIALRNPKSAPIFIGRWLANRKPALLIFDSCDYVTHIVGEFIQTLLKDAPDLKILTTSQQPLNVTTPREWLFRLEPLRPDEAAALFENCVRALDRGFDQGNDAAIVEICRRIGGIPVGIQLAAARVPALGIDAVVSGLAQGQRFRMLTNGPPSVDERQRTLLAVVEWSYGLLDEAERTLFRRLSCVSSFSHEAAIAVAANEGQGRWEVLDILQGLVNKSLISLEKGEPLRYRLLETLQQYGAMKLEESGETKLIARRRLDYLQFLFDAADEIWETMPDPEWVNRYGPEIDNLRGALDWALEQPERTQSGIALCGAAGRLWYMLDLAPEGRRYCDRFVELIDEVTPPADAARLLKRAAMLWRFPDRQRAVATMERAAALYRQIGDRLNLGSVLGLLGGDCVYLGRYAEGEAVLDEAQELLALGNRIKSLITVNMELGLLAKTRNDAAAARSYQSTARDLARKAHDVLRENIAIFNLGEAEFLDGAIDRAIERAAEAASGLRAAGLKSYLAWPLTNLAAYMLLQGNVAAARSYAEEALPLLIEQGGHWLRLGLQGWALVAALEGRHSEAAQLRGFVHADYRRTGEIREPTEQAIADAVDKTLAGILTAQDNEIWTREGAGWSEAHATDFVLRRIAERR